MLEELLAAGHTGAEYDAYIINIREGDQFGSGFVAINPNSKIPGTGGLLQHPSRRGCSSRARYSFTWPTSSTPSFRKTRRNVPSACHGCSGRWAPPPISAAGFGHFYAYAPYKMEYPIRPLHHGGEAPA